MAYLRVGLRQAVGDGSSLRIRCLEGRRIGAFCVGCTRSGGLTVFDVDEEIDETVLALGFGWLAYSAALLEDGRG